MGAAGPRWAVVDELVHELGSLRAVVQEVEAEPDLAEHDVAHELRTSLARAADTIHLVIGGNEGLVSQARRCIAEAQKVGRRARLVLERSRGHAPPVAVAARRHEGLARARPRRPRGGQGASPARRAARGRPEADP